MTDTADGFFSTVVYIAGGLAIIVGLWLAIGAKAWWRGSGANQPLTT